MKFTEGYWLRSENSNALYASKPFKAYEIPGGLRIYSPGRDYIKRDDCLNIGAITIEFTSDFPNIISVKSYHFQGTRNTLPEFEKNIEKQDVKIEINEHKAVMTSGKVKVVVDLDKWGYHFEADGKILTSCGFRNLGYMHYNRKKSTMFPNENYMLADYAPYMVTELSLKPGECVYGFGEKFTAFVKNGQVIETWNEDGGTSSQVSYKCVPFYLTNKGYGVFVDNTNNVSFEVASEKVEYVGFSVPGEELKYNLIYGQTPLDIIKTYTSFTGKPALPPAWSFGLWLSTSFTTNYNEETTSSFIQGMKDRNIPLSVFHFDCFWMKEFELSSLEWNEEIFKDPEGMIKRYKEKGLKITVWMNPYIAQGSKTFEEGLENGYFLMRSDGKGIKQIDWWQAGTAIIDFTNPKACEWFKLKLKKLLDMGIDAFKTDFGERIPVDVKYHNGADPHGMHNFYTYLYNKCVFEFLQEYKGNDAVVFSRSATVGSQKFPVHWGGDSSASYASMAETLRAGLSFALSGCSFWSHDIAGFEDTASADLYKRWTAFGLLSTHSRLHGSTSYRVPWIFDEESNEVLKFYTNLKCKLMPYIYEMAVISHNEGIPTMRPMILEFPSDPAVYYLDMQYMLGESLLVAPIFNEDGICDYYLPDGKWTHYLTNEIKEGGKWYREKYDYFSLPLYVRQNSLLAIGNNDKRPDYEYIKNLTLHLYCLEDMNNAICRIPDLSGNTIASIEITREKNSLNIVTYGFEDELNIVLHGMDEISDMRRIYK